MGKRLLCCMLCACMIMAAFTGCNTDNAETTGSGETEHTLKVGFGRVDITPEESVPLGGYSNAEQRLSTSVSERLYATCIAFTDETDNTILLYHMDLLRSDGDIMVKNRVAVSKETGIPMTQIMVTATHTHSAPEMRRTQFESIQNYISSLEKWMIEAAKLALEDRKEAKMYTSSIHAENLNFVRYYIFSDGTAGSGTVPDGATRVSHLAEPDDEMQLIKFQREGGKDVLLVNWQGHPHRDGGNKKYNVSSDIVGSMRTYLEAELDCQFAYFTGASGNVNNHSMIDGVTPTKDHVEHGQALGGYAVKAAENFKEVKVGKLQILGNNYMAIGKGTTIASMALPLFAFSLGDVAFITAPYEMFDTSGIAIKDGSPFEMTFIATCANAACGYIPTEFAYDCVCSYEIESSKVEKGTAELLEKEFVSMLEQLYKTK